MLGEAVNLFKEVSEQEKTILESLPLYKHPSEVFIDLWNSACEQYGKYNPNTGYFELNGLLDITYQLAIDIYNSYNKGSDQNLAISKFNIRTNIPVVTQWGTDITRYAQNNNVIEVLNLPIVVDGNLCLQSFYGCVNLRKVYNLSHRRVALDSTMFRGCTKLEYIGILKLKSDLYILDCPLLTTESLDFIISNAENTDTINIKIHPDVYNKLTEDLILKASNKNITFIVL